MRSSHLPLVNDFVADNSRLGNFETFLPKIPTLPLSPISQKFVFPANLYLGSLFFEFPRLSGRHSAAIPKYSRGRSIKLSLAHF